MDADFETDFVFKRFDAARQDQIKQLISYTTLLGLSADDLISIGNRLKRIKNSVESKNNKALIKDLFKNVSYLKYGMYNLRFTFSQNGKIYDCEFQHWYDQVVVTNLTNKKHKTFNLISYQVGSGVRGKVGKFLVNIKNGDIKLDF